MMSKKQSPVTLTAEEFEALFFKMFEEGMRLGIAFPVMPKESIVREYYESKIVTLYTDLGMQPPNRLAEKVLENLYRLDSEQSSEPKSQPSDFFPDYNKKLKP